MLMNAIEVSHLKKEYTLTKKRVTVVDDISFVVPEGSLFGFIGPNGAGKTSTIKMLVGLSRPTSGTVSVLGGAPDAIETHKMIGFMPESPQFYQYLTGEEFLMMVADLFDLPHKKAKVKQVLEDVDLVHGAHKKIRTYSKGMLQRLGLAQAMINDPLLLFLDEPLDGLDPLGRAEVKRIVKALKERGKTVFINTHILQDVEEVCDHVAIIDNGVLLKTGTPKEISLGFANLEDAFVSIIKEKRGARTTS
jgi:ABC-2 type transport system ATP-binding protein